MTSGRERVLTMNRGSATLKSTLYEVGGNPGKPADVLVSISVSYSHTAQSAPENHLCQRRHAPGFVSKGHRLECRAASNVRLAR